MNRLSSEAILKVFVIDANDCSPEWLGDSPIHLFIFANFTEENPQFIYSFYDEVYDNDTVSSLFNKQSEKRFIFEILEGDSTLFKLNADSGVLTTLRSLDYHELKEISSLAGASQSSDINLKLLNISISDGLFKTFVTVKIELVPVQNLLTPLHFQHSFYSTSVSEFRYVI